jgi:hypothetical protein
MLFDDLIVAEEDYPNGPCENRQEWLLMYSLGVAPISIAACCRVDVSSVLAVVHRRASADPRWFDHCWMVHDQPAPNDAVPDRPMNRQERKWWVTYDALADHVHGRGGAMPGQNESPTVRVLYGWLKVQRGHYHAGRLTQEKIDALNHLGSWLGTRRGNLEDRWRQRLQEVQQFVMSAGRYPVYAPDACADEKVLAVWLQHQRLWSRRGRLRADRRSHLDGTLPLWEISAISRSGQNIVNTEAGSS